jgi:hypothetical protein
MLCGDCPNFAESSEQNGTVPLSRLGARGGEPACSMLGTGCSITSGPLVQCSNFGTHSTQWGSMVQNSEFCTLRARREAGIPEELARRG